MSDSIRIAGWLAGAALLLAVPAGAADDEELAREDRIKELERKVQVLAEELERTRTELAVPEEPELKSSYGLGPAASKVYDVTRGLSLGGGRRGQHQGGLKGPGLESQVGSGGGGGHQGGGHGAHLRNGTHGESLQRGCDTDPWLRPVSRGTRMMLDIERTFDEHVCDEHPFELQ